jgi:muramoyltetrapeptide carboxypeptidase
MRDAGKLGSLRHLERPRSLRPGGRVGVAAVSGPVDEEKLDCGIASLRNKGYEVVEAENLRARTGFLAGSDGSRAAGYRALLADPSVEAIFFARGGYGASRTLPHLDVEESRANPKIHLGGSDLTALFAWIHRHAALTTFYGPMVSLEMAGEGAGELDWEAVLSGRPVAPHAIGAEDVLAGGTGEGILVGGCLSLLASLCGTPEAVHGEGAILFWEDIGEDTYRIDRLLTQLERSGTFEGLRGMVIGSVVPRPAGESAEVVRDYLRQRFGASPFPVAMGLPAGHLATPRTLPLGARVRLELGGAESKIQNPKSKIGSLAFEGPAVQ